MQKNKKEEHKNPLITYTHDMHINKVTVFFFPKSMLLFQSMLYLTLLVDVYDTVFVIFWNVAVLKLEWHKECKL